MSTRVLIADDHPAFTLGLRLALQSHGFDVVAVARTGEEALTLGAATLPDVAILDVRMPCGSGVDACRGLSALSPRPLVVMLSTYDDAHTLAQAREAGARAFLTKETPLSKLADVIRQLLGEPRLQMISEQEIPTLTLREQDVLQALGEGLSNKEIATRLGVSPETVKDYCSAVFAKLGVTDRLHAIVVARRLGILA